ncbi:MAG: DUF1653 domain-containing protein [Bacteroidales bacterium]|nr:DUF1653 domain-containing protein [Bacteroidales bacterium]MCM1414636.1 DUF1653 domain-containing protein [bacterium]MCM1424661.1 DUF1653 domain-containing protein [bacterium]
MRHNPRPQEMYRHFKGKQYQIRCLAKHSETGEMMVVYQAMYEPFETYVRPLSMFMEEVDRTKYPDAGQKYRFALLGEEEEEEEAFEPAADQQAEEISAPVVDQQTQLNIDPLVLAFLDAGSYEERLTILDSLHSRITDDMINTMAVSVDLEIKEGEIEDRYAELRNCLLTFERYECSRLR